MKNSKSIGKDKVEQIPNHSYQPNTCKEFTKVNNIDVETANALNNILKKKFS